ncbi:MAG TPA: LCP family protein [Anaerolineales bacterium]|nr:LCP family protein [Anaerolineales bacterium]
MRLTTIAMTLALPGITTGCAGLGSSLAAVPQPAAPLILVTPAANASPTPTPFQPPQVEQGAPTSLYHIQVPTLEPFFPTATADFASARTLPSVDLDSLFPTAAAPPPPFVAADAPERAALLSDPEAVSFLLVGSDKRSGGSFRTDTLVVVVLWPQHKQVSMISIPRDLWTYIPEVGMQRINTAYQSGEVEGYSGGGPALLRDTIAYNLGIRVDHMALVDFDGFRRIVNTLGGVDVPVACPYTDWRLIDPSLNPEDEQNWGLFTVEPGVDHMDGELALWYVRSRLKSSDFDRGRRQQEMLRAIFARALRTETLTRVPELYSDFSQAVVTDLGLGDILKLALYAPTLSEASIRSYRIEPPSVNLWVTPAGASVLLPDAEALQGLLRQATSPSAAAVEREAISVEIQNGTALAGMDDLATSRLGYAGYTAHISPADRQDYGSSVLVDLTQDQDPGRRSALLDVLGIPSAAIVPSAGGQTGAQYRVVLGYDYEPCFEPQDLLH